MLILLNFAPKAYDSSLAFGRIFTHGTEALCDGGGPFFRPQVPQVPAWFMAPILSSMAQVRILANPGPPGNQRNLFWRVPLEFRNASLTNELCYSCCNCSIPNPQNQSNTSNYARQKITHPDSDAAAPGEAEVLVALGVPVPDDGLPRVLGQGPGGARVAWARAYLHCKLGWNKKIKS